MGCQQMMIELTEEEREFLERLCVRAKLFCQKNFVKPSTSYSIFETDLESISKLVNKLGKNDN